MILNWFNSFSSHHVADEWLLPLPIKNKSNRMYQSSVNKNAETEIINHNKMMFIIFDFNVNPDLS